MSIRTNPMKAVPVLLKRVKTARSKFHETGRDESFDGKLDKLAGELNKIEDVFMKVKKNQDALLDTLHEVDSHLRKLDRTRLDQDMDAICKRIRDCAHKLLPMESFESESSTQQYNNQSLLPHNNQSLLPHNNQLLLPQPRRVNLYQILKDTEDNQLRNCLWSLSIFPVNAVIKKRQAIYMWIGGWDIMEMETQDKTAEEVGEDMIVKLLELNLIVAYGNGKCPIVNKFKLNPHIHSLVQRDKAERLGYYLTIPYRRSLKLDQQKVTLGDLAESSIAVYNISASYLNFGSKWMDKLQYLRVLQLGRWQDSPSHHIEVVSQEFLKDLSNLKCLWYLSLRGISRIFELPPSIVQIKSLEILDLKACHNLETLPDDISSMRNLTHLILSQCYLLDSMPKGIEKLTKLQVLKGFIIGNSRMTPCTISDLAKLKELRRLSIHIATEAVINDGDFESLGELSALKHLKLSWGVSGTRYSDVQIILPSSLKKLHLQGFRGQRIPEWLKPSKLPRGLKELKITGGKLASMNHDEDMNQWDMEIVRLKYVKHLEIDLTNLKMLFPRLRYALIKPIPYHSYVEWSMN